MIKIKRNYNVDMVLLKVSKFKPRFTIEKGIKEIFGKSYDWKIKKNRENIYPVMV